MRRGWAIFASLFLAAAGPLILGHRRRALYALFADAVAFALALGGELLVSPALLFGGMALFVVVRVAALIASARMALGPEQPGAAVALLSICAIMATDYALALAARAELVEAFKIPAGSMIPTLEVGDHMFVDKRRVTPQRGDVIVFRYPREPQKDFVKRVIALGGETVEWQDETPVVNGKPIPRHALGECHYRDFDEVNGKWEERSCRGYEETVDGRSWHVLQDPNPNLQPRTSFTVPPGSYYVLGDNRDNSHDSRYWGAVPADHVKGTATWIWWSSQRSDRMGLLVK